MSISDADFFAFYQNFLAVIVAEGDGDMPFTANYFGVNVVEEVWYGKAMAALTRLGISGLIYHGEVGSDIRTVLKEMFLYRNEETWLSCYFIPTVAGEKLAKKFLISFDKKNRPQVINNICEKFREELGRIFDEHGVGFDMDLPYDKLLSLDSE